MLALRAPGVPTNLQLSDDVEMHAEAAAHAAEMGSTVSVITSPTPSIVGNHLDACRINMGTGQARAGLAEHPSGRKRRTKVGTT